MVTLARARGPEGLRLYAIGDVHGCLDALEAMVGLIAEDLDRHPAPDWRMVLLGDYVDRGPDSRGVLGWVMARVAEGRTTAVLGNHDAMFLEAMERPDGPTLETWLAIGGVPTIASYGVAPREIPTRPGGVQAVLAAAVPGAHRAFLAGLPLWHRAGDFFFVHAGIDPARPLDAQDPDDLIWIRRPFLDSDAEHAAVVVHGHTPVETVELRPNRIGLDTGCVFGGALSCLVIEGAERRLLSVPGTAPR